MKLHSMRPLALVLAVSLLVSSASLTFAEESARHDSDSGSSQPPLSAEIFGRAAAGNATITSADQLEPFFPDEKFRNAVFKAVQNGKDGAIGTDVENALLNFTGSIKASRLGISDIRGIEKLRHAESIDLSRNQIRDFTAQIRSNPNPDWDGSASKDWYGYQDEDGFWRNTEWDFRGNPFTQLPENFGGLLVIKQPGTTSYTYPDEPVLVFLRDNARQAFSSPLNMAKCRIRGKTADNNFVENGYLKLTHAKPTFIDAGTGGSVINYSNPTATSDIDVQIGNILRTGSFKVGVGTEQVLHYSTSDEYGTITPGSQSFKYYLSQPVEVYDRITMAPSPYKGGFTLHKQDETGAPLASAVFDLYYAGKPVAGQTGLRTGADGKITVNQLPAGTYTLREVKAPAGYALGEDVQVVVGAEAPVLEISGGESSVTYLQGGVSVTERSNDSLRFTKGAPSNTAQPISMAFRGNLAHDKIHGSITIRYSSLNGGSGATRTFPESDHTIADAVEDLNRRINSNSITGPVTIEVNYESVDESITIAHTTVTVQNKRLPDDLTIAVEKHWVGEMVDSGAIPTTITFDLLRDGQAVATQDFGQDGGTFSGTNHGKWPAADEHGRLYTYTINEHPIFNFALHSIDRVASPGSLVFKVENKDLIEPPPPTDIPNEPTEEPPTEPSHKKPPNKSPWVPEEPDEPELPVEEQPVEEDAEDALRDPEDNPGTGGGGASLPALLLCAGGMALLLSRRA